MLGALTAERLDEPPPDGLRESTVPVLPGYRRDGIYFVPRPGLPIPLTEGDEPSDAAP